MWIDWPDALGILGVSFVVGSYLLLQTDRISSSNPHFSLANAVGAALILISLAFNFNLSAFVIEFFWLLISVLGVIRGYSKRSEKAKEAL